MILGWMPWYVDAVPEGWILDKLLQQVWLVVVLCTRKANPYLEYEFMLVKIQSVVFSKREANLPASVQLLSLRNILNCEPRG